MPSCLSAPHIARATLTALPFFHRNQSSTTSPVAIATIRCQIPNTQKKPIANHFGANVLQPVANATHHSHAPVKHQNDQRV